MDAGFSDKNYWEGRGVALSAENEIKGTRMQVVGNRLQEKNEKRYGPAVYGVDFCW